MAEIQNKEPRQGPKSNYIEKKQTFGIDAFFSKSNIQQTKMSEKEKPSSFDESSDENAQFNVKNCRGILNTFIN